MAFRASVGKILKTIIAERNPNRALSKRNRFLLRSFNNKVSYAASYPIRSGINFNPSLPLLVVQRSWKSNRIFLKDGYVLMSLALSVVYANTKDNNDIKESSKDDNRNKVKDADELYSSNKVSELYHFLFDFKECDDAEILWRFARAARDYAQLDSTSKERRKELTFEGFEAAQRAVQLDSNSFACHKWYGIMLSEVGDYKGTRQKIEDSYKIRDHFLKAIELNPTDATSHYLLGVWFFTFADLPWYQKKIAATIFASPPNCTYSEAEEHFLHAENIDPGFYSANQLMLAKTYIKLGKKDAARIWINKLLISPAKTQEDTKNIAEAEHLFRSL